MKKILAFILVCYSSASYANECRQYDYEIGTEIRELNGIMHQYYMRNVLDFKFVDTMMMYMNDVFNNDYQLVFQVASRENTDLCKSIRDQGLHWVAEQREIILNEISSRIQ